jgi:hypothetical protein
VFFCAGKMILAQSAMSGYSGLQRRANAGKVFENRFDFAPLAIGRMVSS